MRWTTQSQIDEAMNFQLSIFIFYSILVTTFAQTGPQIAAYFRQQLSNTSAIYLPSEGNYSFETTQRWNLFSAPTYIVSVKPTSDLDVSKIVRLLASPQKYICLSPPARVVDSVAHRSNMPIVTTYPSSAQVVGTVTQQVWALSETGSRSTSVISIPCRLMQMPTP